MSIALPAGYTLRPARPDDADAIIALLLDAERADYGEPQSGEDDLRAGWSSTNFADDLRLVFDAEGALAAYAEYGPGQQGRMWGFVCVRPTARGRGIGSALLGVVEALARERIGQAPPEARVTLNGGANAAGDAPRRMLERAGYQRIRTFWRMQIELEAEPPAPQWPAGVSLRPFVAERDARAVFDAVEEAFQDHWGHVANPFDEWAGWTFRRARFDPSLWLIAVEGDEIAGVALDRMRGEIGWVGQLAVRRPWRGRGLASALLHESFRTFYRRGVRTVGLSVDAESLTGATRVYERAGMRVAQQFASYQKELRPGVELSTQTLK